MARKKSTAKNGNGDLEFADRLWSTVNRLRDTVEGPPFNMKEWGGEQLREGKRWKFGSPSLESMRPFWRKV